MTQNPNQTDTTTERAVNHDTPAHEGNVCQSGALLNAYHARINELAKSGAGSMELFLFIQLELFQIWNHLDELKAKAGVR